MIKDYNYEYDEEDEGGDDDNMAFIVRNVVMSTKSTELKSILMHSDCRVDYL